MPSLLGKLRRDARIKVGGVEGYYQRRMRALSLLEEMHSRRKLKKLFDVLDENYLPLVINEEYVKLKEDGSYRLPFHMHPFIYDGPFAIAKVLENDVNFEFPFAPHEYNLPSIPKKLYIALQNTNVDVIPIPPGILMIFPEEVVSVYASSLLENPSYVKFLLPLVETVVGVGEEEFNLARGSMLVSKKISFFEKMEQGKLFILVAKLQ